MANFYYGSDSGQNYWINLDHVSFVNPEENKLILKMLGNFAGEHLTYAMSINTYRCQQLENLQLDHKEK